MPSPRTILVPVDFSEPAEAALDYAVSLAEKLEAKIHLLHVIDLQGLQFSGVAAPMVAEILDLTVASNQSALERTAATRRVSGRIGELLLRTGDPRLVIDQIARQLGVDLIVMGTHGRRGFKRLTLGSVAETIVRTAPCPVLTVHPPT